MKGEALSFVREQSVWTSYPFFSPLKLWGKRPTLLEQWAGARAGSWALSSDNLGCVLWLVWQFQSSEIVDTSCFPTQWLPQWTDWPLVVPILSFYVISTLYIPFYRWGNWGIEKFRNLPGVMLGFRAQALCLQCHSLNHFNTLPHHIICTWNVFFYSPLDRKILKER